MKRLSILLALMLVTGLAFADSEGRGYLGVSIATVDNIDEGSDQNGVYISSVSHGSGAEAAGLKAEDRIISINGFRVEDMDDLEAQLKISRPGDSVDLVALRAGREEGFQVILGGPSDFKKQFDIAKGKYLVELQEARPRMGVQLQALSPQLAEFFEVEGGALITSVSEESAAQQAGLRAGDIILDVDGHTINSQHDTHEALAGRQAGQAVDVTVQSRGRLEVLAVTLDEALDKEKMAAFNIMLSRTDESASKTMELDVPASWSFEVETSEGSADDIRTKIHKLEQELERLHEQLERQGND